MTTPQTGTTSAYQEHFTWTTNRDSTLTTAFWGTSAPPGNPEGNTPTNSYLTGLNEFGAGTDGILSTSYGTWSYTYVSPPGAYYYLQNFPRSSDSSTKTIWEWSSITIPSGYGLQFTGTKPITFKCQGATTISGVIFANGKNGTQGSATTSSMSSMPAGGSGVAGGGQGGGHTSFTAWSGPTNGADGTGGDGVVGGSGAGKYGKGYTWSGPNDSQTRPARTARRAAAAAATVRPVARAGPAGPPGASPGRRLGVGHKRAHQRRGAGRGRRVRRRRHGADDSTQYYVYGGTGGGGGGSFFLNCAGTLTLASTGLIEMKGGNGGNTYYAYTNSSYTWYINSGGGGGGSGGAVKPPRRPSTSRARSTCPAVSGGGVPLRLEQHRRKGRRRPHRAGHQQDGVDGLRRRERRLGGDLVQHDGHHRLDGQLRHHGEHRQRPVRGHGDDLAEHPDHRLQHERLLVLREEIHGDLGGHAAGDRDEAVRRLRVGQHRRSGSIQNIGGNGPARTDSSNYNSYDYGYYYWKIRYQWTYSYGLPYMDPFPGPGGAGGGRGGTNGADRNTWSGYYTETYGPFYYHSYLPQAMAGYGYNGSSSGVGGGTGGYPRSTATTTDPTTATCSAALAPAATPRARARPAGTRRRQATTAEHPAPRRARATSSPTRPWPSTACTAGRAAAAAPAAAPGPGTAPRITWGTGLGGGGGGGAVGICCAGSVNLAGMIDVQGGAGGYWVYPGTSNSYSGLLLHELLHEPGYMAGPGGGGGGGNIKIHGAGGITISGASLNAAGGIGGKVGNMLTSAQGSGYLFGQGGDGGLGGIRLTAPTTPTIPDMQLDPSKYVTGGGTVGTGAFALSDTGVTTWQDGGAVAPQYTSLTWTTTTHARVYVQGAQSRQDNGLVDTTNVTAWTEYASGAAPSIMNGYRYFRIKLVLQMVTGTYPMVDYVLLNWQYAY